MKWANGNQRYKDPDFFQFSKGVDGCGTQPDKSKPGCGHSVTLCSKCVRSSILGNLIYGLVGRYAGFSGNALKTGATGTKKTWGLSVDKYDEIAYGAGATIYGGGFEESFNLGNLCNRIEESLTANPGALNEGNTKGGYNDLGSCKLCAKNTNETRHGGNESTRMRP